MDAAGEFTVSWDSDAQDGSAQGVYAQQYDAAGVPMGGEFRVNTATANAQAGSGIAMDALGDFTIEWSSNLQDGSGYGVYAQRYVLNRPPPNVMLATPDNLAIEGASPADSAKWVFTRSGGNLAER